jgi:hypothetical protein
MSILFNSKHIIDYKHAFKNCLFVIVCPVRKREKRKEVKRKKDKKINLN